MANYKFFKDMSTEFIVEKSKEIIKDSAKESSDNNKSFIRTLGDNIANKAISDIAAGLFGREATLVFDAAAVVMKGVDSTFQYGREKAIHEAATGVISFGQLGNGLYKSSEIAGSMRQKQVESMNADIQSNRAMFGNEARKRAMNTTY